MKRRDFLRKTLTGAAITAGANIPVQAETPKCDLSEWVSLTPNVRTSRLGLGTGVFGSGRQSNLTRMDRAKALDIVRYCYDCGIRFFDMADMYGTHGIIAEALAGKPRDSYVLSTKIWGHPGGLPEQERPTADVMVPRFLKELHTDYLDMVQIHCLMNDRWESEFARYFDSLNQLKEQGIIRAHGVSCHSLRAAQQAAVNPWVDAMHIRMNTANTRMEGTWDEAAAVTATAKKHGKGVIVMKILGEGSIKDPAKRRESTLAVARLATKDVMIVGFEAREHVDEFLTNLADA